MTARAERIVATILGCGSSGGVPRIGNIWGDCDPDNPKNRRRRCALLLTGTTPGMDGKTNILIDTGCDLREQLLDAEVKAVDAVFYTHEHADHTHGIDDLRVLALNNHQRVDVYFTRQTGERIRQAFGYCFSTPPGSNYPPILNAHEIAAGQTLHIDGPGGAIEISSFLQEHGEIQSLGFRIGNFAYSCDLNGIPEQSLPAVSDLDLWVLDALKRTPHPSHLSFREALDWIARMQPRHAVLTDMHTDMDYAAIEAETPANVNAAYDGMKIDVLAGKIIQR